MSTHDRKNVELAPMRRTMWAGFKSLGLDKDETARRGFIKQTIGKESVAGIGYRDLNKVLVALKERGFKVHKKRFQPPQKPHSKKIWALWFALRDAGAIENANAEALRAWIKRMMAEEHAEGIIVTGSPDLLSLEHAQWIIECLKRWARRVGAEVR